MPIVLNPIVPAFVLLGLYDLYFPGSVLPVLPLVGAAVLATVLLVPRALRPSAVRVPYDVLATSMVLLALVCISTFLGLMHTRSFIAKTPLGLAAGIAMFLMVVACRTERTYFKALNVVAVVHVAFVFTQLGYLLVTGQYLDYVQLVTGTESRYLYSTFDMNITRITGLFAEPAALATFMYMLLVARAIGNGWKLRSLDYLLIATIVLSLSVYGFFLVATFLALRLKLAPSVVIRFVVAASLLSGSVIALLIWQGNINEYLASRLSDPLSDPSGAVRFVEGFVAFYDLPLMQQVIGLGVGTQDELVGRTNGAYFLLEKLGVVMTPLWLVVFGLMLRTGRLSAREITAVFVTLLGAPLLTNLFWWTWLGVLWHLGNRRARIQAGHSGQQAFPRFRGRPMTNCGIKVRTNRGQHTEEFEAETLSLAAESQRDHGARIGARS